MDQALAAFATLFVIVDPVGTAPLFIALTADHDAEGKRRVAALSIAVSFGVLLVFGLTGRAVLDFAGISMPAFRIAGGILLLLTAIDMLFETRTERREKRVSSTRERDAEAEGRADPSVFPLAIPLIAGPGAITAMILLMGEREGDPAAQAAVLGTMAAVLLLTYVLFRLGERIGRLLGRTGIVVVTRLMGMLLAALAVQFALDGLGEALPALLGARAGG